MSVVHTSMPYDLIDGTRCGHSDPEAGTGGTPEVADIFRAYGEA